MSVTGLSIVLMAIVAGGALLAAMIAESAQSAPSSRRLDAAGAMPADPSNLLRCRPKILPKCPKGEKRVCLETKAACCIKFGCRRLSR